MNPLRSNLDNWKRLQEKGYFESHPCYLGLRDFSGREDVAIIEQFSALDESKRVVVIGCGYGRETAYIAPRVRHVYGIDVSSVILQKALGYLTDKGVSNFTPVLAELYKTDIPDGIDIVFSIVVMQHLTRDIVRDYFRSLAGKLNPSGVFVVQFLEDLTPGPQNEDAELIDYEPSVTWTIRQLHMLCIESGLVFKEVRTYQVTPTALWHWACFSKPVVS